MAGASQKVARRLAIAALVAASIGAVVVLLLPGQVTVVQEATVPGAAPSPPVTSTSSLLSSEGVRVLALFAFPVLVAAAGLWPRRDARIIAASFLWLFVLAGAFSFGIFFVPAAALMTLAAVQTPRRTRSR